jgi:hypothetical protein
LQKWLNESGGASTIRQVDSELFKVDPMSNMTSTASVIWDEKSSTPFDVVLTKTDVSYGLYGMHNFYKMQLLGQNVRVGAMEEVS